MHAPRLAVSFCVFGLALVGLPGTLSFCSQDLLIHGTLMSHPVTGVVLPIATAMNAVTVFRLFARLFLGKRRTGFTHMADALPRERWTLAAGVLFVVVGGLFPNLIVGQRFAEIDAVGQERVRPQAVRTTKLLSTIGYPGPHGPDRDTLSGSYYTANFPSLRSVSDRPLSDAFTRYHRFPGLSYDASRAAGLFETLYAHT